MDDFKTIARLLAAIRAGERGPAFNTALVDERVLKTTAENRDALARKLAKAGYIDGLYIVETLDEGPNVILWEESHPEVTMKGLEFMQQSEPLHKAIQELKSVAAQTAAAVIANQLGKM